MFGGVPDSKAYPREWDCTADLVFTTDPFEGIGGPCPDCDPSADRGTGIDGLTCHSCGGTGWRL